MRLEEVPTGTYRARWCAAEHNAYGSVLLKFDVVGVGEVWISNHLINPGEPAIYTDCNASLQIVFEPVRRSTFLRLPYRYVRVRVLRELGSSVPDYCPEF